MSKKSNRFSPEVRQRAVRRCRTSVANRDEGPAHAVTLARPFAMGKYEVTKGEWKAVMGSNPSDFQQCGDNCPVEQVSWNDAQSFIQKLNANTGKSYRPPRARMTCITSLSQFSE